MILEIFSILVLAIPIAWECYDDRQGDDHTGNDDWRLRGLLMILTSVFVWFINPHHNFIQDFFLSFAMFTALFPYLINYIHHKRGVTSDKKWWSHLSSKAIPDKWPWWKATPWYGRMLFYAIFLGIAVKLYFCWYAFTAWNACR